MAPAQKVAFVNLKGGVGKTTSAINTGAALAEMGHETLVIDSDRQGDATKGLGYTPDELKGHTLYEAQVTPDKTGDYIVPVEGFERLWLLPGHRALADSEATFHSDSERDYRTRLVIEALEAHPRWSKLQFILLDCPPDLGHLTVNALLASDLVVILLQAEPWAFDSLPGILRVIGKLQKRQAPDLKLAGVLLTMVNGRLNLTELIREELQEANYDRYLFKTIIPRSVSLPEAAFLKQPVIRYAPASAGARAYRAFAEEFLSHVTKQNRVAAQTA